MEVRRFGWLEYGRDEGGLAKAGLARPAPRPASVGNRTLGGAKIFHDIFWIVSFIRFPPSTDIAKNAWVPVR
jgi:hypothetical protein